jgi:signal transduction histidine kinase
MDRIPSGIPRSRIALVVAFAIVALALALVDALVVLEIEPQLRSLRDIANEHARAVEVTTQIRARLSAARGDLLAAMASEHADVARAATAATALTLIQASTDTLAPLADKPQEQEDLAALRASLERCAAEAVWIRMLLERGDAAGARLRMHSLVELTSVANDAADQIVSFNAVEVENLSRSASQSLRWAVLGATLLAVSGGAAALLLLRRALRGLAAEEASASARSAELEAFAARAAHELRTPLQTVSLALRALERGSTPGSLQMAHRSVERLRLTVDGLLEFSRAGAAPERPAATDLSRVLGDVQEELAPQIASAMVSVQVDIPPGTNVAIASTHVATIMRNLLGNAVKHAVSGPNARICIRATRATAGIHIEVEDNGPGISPEALPRVFEPFVRATSRSGGHGLGLATVKRLVEAHRGAVRISSAPGHGTTVALDLPGCPAGTPPAFGPVAGEG